MWMTGLGACVRARKKLLALLLLCRCLGAFYSLFLSLSPAYYNLSVSRNSLYVRTWRVCELFTHIFKRRRRLSSLLVCCLTFSLSFFWLTHSRQKTAPWRSFARSLLNRNLRGLDISRKEGTNVFRVLKKKCFFREAKKGGNERTYVCESVCLSVRQSVLLRERFRSRPTTVFFPREKRRSFLGLTLSLFYEGGERDLRGPADGKLFFSRDESTLGRSRENRLQRRRRKTDSATVKFLPAIITVAIK